MQALSIAFNRPETALRLSPSKERPIDLVHLARQTMGNKDLEQEVLRLFVRQARACSATMESCDTAERARVAHMLKGSARGVGAFVVAERAEKVESAPYEASLVGELAAAVLDVENFLLRLSR